MTSADLARVDTTASLLPAVGYANESLRQLGEWVTAADSVSKLVATLVDTPFVPDNYRPRIDPRATPEQKAEARHIAIATGTAAVLQGTKLGFDPLTSLQQIIIIHGRPSMYAQAMVALLLAHGHEVWDEDLTEHRAVVCGRRRGEDRVVRIQITMEMARKAGWTKNETYAKTPQDMLWARAASRVCKRVAPEVLLGIESVEEAGDSVKATAQTGTRTVTPRRALPAAEHTPAATVTPTQAESDQGLDERQWRAINELMREQGIVGQGQREARLDRIREIVGRSVTRGTDLTYAEGENILAELRRPAGPDVVDGDGDNPVDGAVDDTGGASIDDELLDDDWPPVPEIPTTEEPA